jgi:hypothetical protein
VLLGVLLRHEVLPEVIVEVLVKESAVHVQQDVAYFLKGDVLHAFSL